jgi:hypothetical protein
MKIHCTYCESKTGSTNDHIPPKGFFQKPLPNNAQLITVPCCEACQKTDQKQDGFVRNLFCSLFDTEDHPTIKNDIALRRNRSFERDYNLAQQLADIMVNKDMVAPTGVHVGKAPAFDLELPVINEFIERVCRAVIFDAFKQTYFSAQFDWWLNPQISASMLSIAPATSKQRNVLDVFHYLVTPVPGKSHYWIILTFYQNMRILGHLRKIN